MGGRKKRLRSGFTTGTAAAAATKAALLFLVSGRRQSKVTIHSLNGKPLVIKVHTCRCMDADTAVCSVIKDAGDDPDITHGAEIGAHVVWKAIVGETIIAIHGGQGVGKVTKPGLEVPPGHPAINPGPQKMIRTAVQSVLDDHGLHGHVDTKIFVPQGEILARRTLNARLGIIGGISILGTTGIVQPLSHKAYTATISAALKVARASGLKQVVLSTGRRSERYCQQRWPWIPDEGFVQIGDYFAETMQMTAQTQFTQVVLGVFFGKAVKMAQGVAHTHARSARMTLATLAQWTEAITGNADLARQVAKANTARHAFDMIKDDAPGVIEKVGHEVVRWATIFSNHRIDVKTVIFGFDGSVRFDTAKDLA